MFIGERRMKKPADKYLMLSITVLTALSLVFIQTSAAIGCGCWDIKPPKIHWVMQYPETPEYEDNVLVLAYITDSGSGVANATLYWTINGQQTTEIKMNGKDGLFYAEIPALPYNLTIAYVVYAYDKAGNKACSQRYTYVVNDFHPPAITFIQQIPFKPNYNETVTIIANATEPANASGVKEFRLSYWNGFNWTTVIMELDGALYTAAIPEFPYGTTVQYRVSVVDRAGNIAELDVYAYEVEDRYMPVAVLLTPKNGSFVSKVLNITFYAYDDNFYEANLTLDSILQASWNQTGTYTYALDTATLSSGLHALTLEALDKARNRVENTVYITVDNTAPTIEIRRPLDKSFVNGLVLVEISVYDDNFEHAELKIDGVSYIFETNHYIYAWNTLKVGDGEHKITLTAVDKAGNKAEKQIAVTVDNTAPIIDSVAWTPRTPSTNETVTVSAKIRENGSGLRDVSLWFRCIGEEWQKRPMTLKNGNWTAIIPEFKEDVTVTFYVECVDKAGNIARSAENYYVVKAVITEGFMGIPLHWLAVAVLAIFAVLASTAYYLMKKKRGAASTFLSLSP
ncbi:MAG: Ig-like domain-containing protein [Candidatus Bathyarchaeia archaeon]